MLTRCLLVALCVYLKVPPMEGTFRNHWGNYLSRFHPRRCVPRTVAATCSILPDPQAPFTVTGVVDFKQTDNCRTYGPLEVTVKLSGFPPVSGIRRYGHHVHEFGDLSNGCASTGGHYNPFNMTHGAPFDNQRHVGDFGNFPLKPDGTVSFSRTDRVASLFTKQSIIGRAVVIHSRTDDLGRGGNAESLRTGNAGTRLACCVIGRTSAVNVEYAVENAEY